MADTKSILKSDKPANGETAVKGRGVAEQVTEVVVDEAEEAPISAPRTKYH